MTTSAAVGKSTIRRAQQAGHEAATKALAGLPQGKADIVLVFATAGLDQAAMIHGVREVVGDALLAGCSGEGIITQDGADEGAHAVAVMAIASDKMTFQTFRVDGYSKDTRAAGVAIADRVREAGPKRAKIVLLFPDGLTGNCSDMLTSLHANLPFPVIVAGGTAADMMTLQGTFQYHEGSVGADSVVGVLIGGEVAAEYIVSHGCYTLGVERTVTSSDGARVMTIDDRPAWDVFREYLDGNPEELSGAESVHICLGERLPSTLDQSYGDLIIRTPAGLDKATGSLFFPGGLAQGSKIHMTRRDPERIRTSAVESARALLAKCGEHRPSLIFQFDCAGRAGMIFGNKTTEFAVEPIQSVIGRDVPWLGFHTYGEIAQLGGVPYFHNYSVVLCALYETASGT